MRMLQGRAVSPGIAIGRVLIFNQCRNESTEKQQIECGDAEAEKTAYQHAVQIAKQQITELYERTKQTLGDEKAAIFLAHLEILDDPALEESVMAKIENGESARCALQAAVSEFESMFAAIKGDYMRERVADFRDVSGRIRCCLSGEENESLSCLPYDCIIIAHDLTPSETVTIDLDRILGFALDGGGRTSHTAILSRSLAIPAVVGFGTITQEVKSGDFVIMDAILGSIYINPDEDTLMLYERKKDEFNRRQEALKSLRILRAETKDGARIELCANIGSVEDAIRAKKNGSDGIGLFRTEFLYMENTHFPEEEEQFDAYRAVAETMAPGAVIIRTLDIGGDKELSYFTFPAEENPFLGWRAIRFCLDNILVFKTQLRAILRASAYGKLRIMFPMIISLDEFYRAKALLTECQQELQDSGIPFDAEIKTGIMVETPAAIILADEFAKVVDFFSIGTNDLTQYTLAVDRGNVKLESMYDPFNPAVIRSIKHIIDASHRAGKWTGMCGEFAGDPRATKLLLGLGLDEFSVTAALVPVVKETIRSIDTADAKAFADKLIQAASVAEVVQSLHGE